VVKACSYHEALEGNSDTASDTETELSTSSCPLWLLGLYGSSPWRTRSSWKQIATAFDEDRSSSCSSWASWFRSSYLPWRARRVWRKFWHCFGHEKSKLRISSTS